jgi:hypothetical protein
LPAAIFLFVYKNLGFFFFFSLTCFFGMPSAGWSPANRVIYGLIFGGVGFLRRRKTSTKMWMLFWSFWCLTCIFKPQSFPSWFIILEFGGKEGRRKIQGAILNRVLLSLVENRNLPTWTRLYIVRSFLFHFLNRGFSFFFFFLVYVSLPNGDTVITRRISV